MLEDKNNVKATKFILSPNERAALIESKIDRANAQLQSMLAQIEVATRIKKSK